MTRDRRREYKLVPPLSGAGGRKGRLRLSPRPARLGSWLSVSARSFDAQCAEKNPSRVGFAKHWEPTHTDSRHCGGSSTRRAGANRHLSFTRTSMQGVVLDDPPVALHLSPRSLSSLYKGDPSWKASKSLELLRVRRWPQSFEVIWSNCITFSESCGSSKSECVTNRATCNTVNRDCDVATRLVDELRV